MVELSDQKVRCSGLRHLRKLNIFNSQLIWPKAGHRHLVGFHKKENIIKQIVYKQMLVFSTVPYSFVNLMVEWMIG